MRYYCFDDDEMQLLRTVNEIDREQLVDKILDLFCRFGMSSCVSLLIFDEQHDVLRLEGVRRDHHTLYPNILLPVSQLHKEIQEHSLPVSYALQWKEGLYPLPTMQENDLPYECLTLPLIGKKRQLNGFVAIMRKKGSLLEESAIFQCIVASTITAIALQNAGQFQLSLVDELTGLFNRRYFTMRLEEELHRLERTQEELALLMVDIDHFKSVNDTYGHLVGDKVLREIACQFKGIIRAGLDVICRFGGEEFAAILTKMSRQEARQIAERLRRACRETDYAKDCGTIHLTVSIGVVTVDASSTGVSAKDLLQRVDTMLYAAKEEGRDQVKEW